MLTVMDPVLLYWVVYRKLFPRMASDCCTILQYKLIYKLMYRYMFVSSYIYQAYFTVQWCIHVLYLYVNSTYKMLEYLYTLIWWCIVTLFKSVHACICIFSASLTSPPTAKVMFQPLLVCHLPKFAFWQVCSSDGLSVCVSVRVDDHA